MSTTLVPSYYYNEHIRRLISAIGEMFTGMAVVRFKPDGTPLNIVNNIQVKFLMKDKFYGRKWVQAIDDGNLGTKGHPVYPRIGYTLESMEYDGSRSLASQQRIIQRNQGVKNKGNINITRTPWNFNFQIVLASKNLSDVLQLFEQIAPNFDPAHCITIDDYPLERGAQADIQTFLTGVTIQDNSDEALDESTRLVVFTLSLTAQYWLYSATGNGMEKNIQSIRTGDDSLPSVKPLIEELYTDVYMSKDGYFASENRDWTIVDTEDGQHFETNDE